MVDRWREPKRFVILGLASRNIVASTEGISLPFEDDDSRLRIHLNLLKSFNEVPLHVIRQAVLSLGTFEGNGNDIVVNGGDRETSESPCEHRGAFRPRGFRGTRSPHAPM